MGRTHRCAFVARPLHTADLIEKFEADVRERRRKFCDLVHDFGFVVVVHLVTQRLGEFLCDEPLVLALLRRHDGAYAINAPLGVDECAVFLQERRTGQEYVCEFRGLVQEQVLHDDALPCC